MHIGSALNMASVTSAITINFYKLESIRIVSNLGFIFESKHRLTLESSPRLTLFVFEFLKFLFSSSSLPSSSSKTFLNDWGK